MRLWTVIPMLAIATAAVVLGQQAAKPDGKYFDTTKPNIPFIDWPYLVGEPGTKAHIRDDVSFPDVEGFQVLKADFHSHTIYSDGQVTPEVRVWEAWRDGLDLIAIADHHEMLQIAVPQ